MSSRAFLLSFHQLLLLLYKKEADNIILPKQMSDLEADETQLKSAMGELITDKYLLPGPDGKYAMSPEIAQIMDIISGASNSLIIQEIHGRVQPFYLYRLNLSAVLLNVDTHHDGWIRLEIVRSDDWLQELIDDEQHIYQISMYKATDSSPDLMVLTDDQDRENIINRIMEV